MNKKINTFEQEKAALSPKQWNNEDNRSQIKGVKAVLRKVEMLKEKRKDKQETSKGENNINTEVEIEAAEINEIREEDNMAIPIDTEQKSMQMDKAPKHDQNSQQKEENDQGNPQVLNLQTVIRGIGNEVEQYKLQNDLLTGVVSRMNDELQEAKSRITQLEAFNMRRSIVLNGYYRKEKRKVDYIIELEDFFMKEANVEVIIEDAYPIGNAKPKAMVIVFETVRYKHDIFQKRQRIEAVINKDGVALKMFNQKSMENREQGRRFNDIFQSNDAKEEREKVNIEVKQGKLIIEGEPYVKKVSTPGAQALLNMDTHEIDNILQVPIYKGGKIEQQGSTFIAYTTAVETWQAVQLAYHKVKLMHADARHVVCGFIIPGNHPCCEDFCEDEESGIGARLLNFMRYHELSNRAFFVVRYYGGQRMGPARFECYIEAAKAALLEHPHNDIIKQVQSLKEEAKKGDERQSREYVRGRGRGGRPQRRPTRRALYNSGNRFPVDQLNKRRHETEEDGDVFANPEYYFSITATSHMAKKPKPPCLPSWF